jgi:putative ABC transport system substrate-binding protein
MDRRTACLALTPLWSPVAFPVRAQPARIQRVAWTSIDHVNPQSPFLRSFRTGLRTLGWVEGVDVTIDPWWGGGSQEGLKKLVPEILASRPDLIVSAGGPATRVMIDSNVPIPIAFTVSADAVIGKFVQNWARPDVNRTGISLFSLELLPKRIQLIHEVLPGMRRMAIVGWPPHAGELLELEAATKAAVERGLQHRYWGAHSAAELDTVLEAVAQWRADAALVFAGGLASLNGRRFAAFAADRRIPTFSSWSNFADEGNLMTYGPVIEECYARLASYADRILKGAKPANLPVERPTKFELVVNMKVAKLIGTEIPRSILLRADRIIE